MESISFGEIVQGQLPPAALAKHLKDRALHTARISKFTQASIGSDFAREITETQNKLEVIHKTLWFSSLGIVQQHVGQIDSVLAKDPELPRYISVNEVLATACLAVFDAIVNIDTRHNADQFYPMIKSVSRKAIQQLMEDFLKLNNEQRRQFVDQGNQIDVALRDLETEPKQVAHFKTKFNTACHNVASRGGFDLNRVQRQAFIEGLSPLVESRIIFDPAPKRISKDKAKKRIVFQRAAPDDPIYAGFQEFLEERAKGLDL